MKIKLLKHNDRGYLVVWKDGMFREWNYIHRRRAPSGKLIYTRYTYFGIEHGITGDALEDNIMQAIDNVLEHFNVVLDTSTTELKVWKSLREMILHRDLLVHTEKGNVNGS